MSYQNKRVCHNCGIQYLTPNEIYLSELGVHTSIIGSCHVCKEKANLLPIRHYNYLKKQKMNILELRRGMMVVNNSVDKLIQKMQKEDGIKGSRELSLSKTSAQTAMMWSGNFLKYSGLGENPYAENDGNRKTVEDIKPLFDATEDTISQDYYDQGNIVVIDQLRGYIDAQMIAFNNYISSDELEELSMKEEVQEFLLITCALNILTHLGEARMWLGMELGRIRDNS